MTVTLRSDCKPCNWDEASSWVGGVVLRGDFPPNGSTIIIPAGTEVRVRGGNTKIAINNSVDLQIFGLLNFSTNSSELDLKSPGSQIQVLPGGDILASGNGQSETLKVGNGSISGDDINRLLSPNVITEATLTSPSKAGCAELSDCESTPLPVTLLFFNARATQQSDVHLTWATASEENFHYFVVERSTDGERFELVTTVESTGGNTNVRQDYQFTDLIPYPGLSYYRLTSIDYDGYTEVFNMVAVRVNHQINPVIYPNPSSGTHLHIRGLSLENPFSITITNLQGISQFVGNHLTEPTIYLHPMLREGMYIVNIQVVQEMFTQRMIVK